MPLRLASIHPNFDRVTRRDSISSHLDRFHLRLLPQYSNTPGSATFTSRKRDIQSGATRSKRITVAACHGCGASFQEACAVLANVDEVEQGRMAGHAR